MFLCLASLATNHSHLSVKVKLIISVGDAMLRLIQVTIQVQHLPCRDYNQRYAILYNLGGWNYEETFGKQRTYIFPGNYIVVLLTTLSSNIP